MSKPSTLRRYGKQARKPKSERLFVELPQTPIRIPKTGSVVAADQGIVDKLTEGISTINLQDENEPPQPSPKASPRRTTRQSVLLDSLDKRPAKPQTPRVQVLTPPKSETSESTKEEEQPADPAELRVLSWAEVCPPGDRIVKIAEASYAEVYRVSNERGTSIIKVIRMESAIKAQTKAQQKSGLVDEEPHRESDLQGELRISEWLADIPGFVVYKERYVVQGRACRELLDTHQAFHKKAKRQDPDRLQFYPSPSRYLDGTRFLVVELGDAGTALEDFELAAAEQLWDILFHVAIALARAEARIEFEHRDLHEGNLCIRSLGEQIPKEEREFSGHFGFSGLEITILDYGLSRARDHLESDDEPEPVAYDLERDLSLFTSDHAPQCKVYRQMRSFFLRGDRVCLPPKSHKKAYAEGVDGPISWAQHEPYTNVLWLAYIYEWMLGNFRGPKKEAGAFRRQTKDLWLYLNPEAHASVPGFESASDIVRFAVEAGWIEEAQLMGGSCEVEKSILSILAADKGESFVADRSLRRSPRRRRPSAV
ncbi:Uu.00g057220.m01.CDS01 [Anthostomella pinea]|uniref:non-specific serine/threonine protein kinase n=1 Tax=Anthostomella pinea TaxID=933095 RepID=A0AAI8VST7_9PEZI|nr:Uu.00g057220.m01.CDS01 [Anthostomella pinea]